MREKESHCSPKYWLQWTCYNAKCYYKEQIFSEMKINKIKLKVQSKYEKQLQNDSAYNISAHSDQPPIIQLSGDIESQNTTPLQTYLNPKEISNNVQNGLNPEEINIDPQSQAAIDEINKLKEKVLVEWIKNQNIEISERNSLPKIKNTNKNQSTISKINLTVKNIIHEREFDLTSLNHLIYAPPVISTELCGVKIKAPKINVPAKYAWQEHIQKHINTLCSDFETIQNVKNDSNIKISKSRKLRAKYEIKLAEEIQTVS